jgi:hypothetical protein
MAITIEEIEKLAEKHPHLFFSFSAGRLRIEKPAFFSFSFCKKEVVE